jgi:hypothetical protein
MSHGYLTALGVHIVARRELDAGDRAGALIAILVSRAVARLLFGLVATLASISVFAHANARLSARLGNRRWSIAVNQLKLLARHQFRRRLTFHPRCRRL